MPLRGRAQRVRVTVDAGAVGEAEFLCDARRAAPAKKSSLDFLAHLVGANGARSLVPPKAHLWTRHPCSLHAAIVVRPPCAEKVFLGVDTPNPF